MKIYEKQMVRELELRGLSSATRKSYLRGMSQYINYHKKDPKDLGIEEIKDFLYFFKNEKSTWRSTLRSPNSVNGVASAISFYYQNVLNKNYYGEIPRMKSRKYTPIILSTEEVEKMITGLQNSFWKAVVMTLYSTGMRQAELRNLKISDLNTERMIIHIRNGKGGKDREVILSQNLLDCLRGYWQCYRIDCNSEVKSDYLFIPNKNSYNGVLKKSLSHTAVGYIVKRAADFAGIKKKSILIA